MERLLKFLPPRTQPRWIGYAVTAGLLLCTFLILMGLRYRAGPYGFILFIPPLMYASLAFGRGPGIFALALSVAAVATTVAWTPQAREHLAPFVVFILIGAGLVIVCEGMRTALERAIEAEREKDLLLRELGHRVKNNFAIAASILGLQARSQSDPAVRNAFESARARLSVMAKAHDHLQQAGQNGLVDMKDYIEEMGRNLADTLRDARAIALRVQADRIWIKAEKAVPIGIIVNELVTNAFKYAFPGESASGSISVQLRREENGSLRLSVVDTGIGCPDEAYQGLGSKLVTLFTEQLGGTLSRSGVGGTGCRVEALFPLEVLSPQ